MSQKILLDANLLIAAFDKNGTTSAEKKAQAKNQLSEMLSAPDTVLFITPLIRYEVLRGIGWTETEDFALMQNILNQFPELDITRNVSELSANLFRFDRWESEQPPVQARNLEKRKFDIFHFSSASCNELKLSSNDNDIDKITTLHQRYCQN